MDDSKEFLVTLGASVALSQLERTLLQACEDLGVRRVTRGDLLALGDGRLVFVEIWLETNAPCDGGFSSANRGLVRWRHTPSATLRRVIKRTVSSFGSVRLFVGRSRSLASHPTAMAFRTQRTTLAGFLRSGRVVQEDTLLHIVHT
jgi:hypothetical protein